MHTDNTALAESPGLGVPVDAETLARVDYTILPNGDGLPDGSGIAYVGTDDQNRTGIYAQDFVPGSDTSSTRRPLAGFSSELTTESFGISPDGRRITLAVLEESARLMLAEGIPGVDRPR